MALTTPLVPSPTTNALPSAFSPHTDSPGTPARFHAFPPNGHTLSNRSSAASDSLAPPPSPYPQQIEPSPVDSNGTEIEEDEQEDAQGKSPGSETHTGPSELLSMSPDIDLTSPASAKSEPPKIDTQLPARRSDSPNNDPQSVIHVPSGFRTFDHGRTSSASHVSPTEASEATARLASPITPEASVVGPAHKKPLSPVDTNVPASMDRSTPRAKTRQEFDQPDRDKRRSRTSSLEDIPEALDKDQESDAREIDNDGERPEAAGRDAMTQAKQALDQVEDEVAALRTALSECWTLCNTLAGLSSSHRQRTFQFSGRQEVQEQAWRSCWRLCQQLYEHKDEDHTAQITPTLELCRDFCQSLFDARQKMDEASDSVLRVSFELNNHLYNTHDRTLPDAFNERTLDFYITLCHRLMKLPTSLPHETDALLRACWSLAEQLFHLRQSGREGKTVDEDLVGSAVQACWELCDLFREGWTQVRPERGTPRPTRTLFHSQSSYKSSSTRSDARSVASARSNRDYHHSTQAHAPPETPVTVFDDTSTANSSPDDANVPNILVLGPASNGGGGGSTRGGAPHHERWTSTASVLSDYSESASSQHTSSTATASNEDTQLTRLRYLLLKAGLNTGYQRTSTQSLPAHVQSLPDDAFGTLPWQMKVLSFYKKLVMNDKSMLTVNQSLGNRRLNAVDVAKSVRWLGNGNGGQWAWMRDLFRLVFGFGLDEAERRGGSFVV